MIWGFVESAARVIGYAVLSAFGVLFLTVFLSQLAGEIAAERGGDAAAESTSTVNDIIDEEFEHPSRVERLKPHRSDLAHLDWSVSDTATREEVMALKSALESSGYHAHPFPQTPESPFHDEWRWSSKVVGVWAEEPTFYAETEGGNEIEVTPDLSSWVLMTEYDSAVTGEKYGYNDDWEREHIHS